MANLYRGLDQTDTLKNIDGGYVPQIWVAPVNTFTDVKAPVIGEPAVLGDKVKITAAHTFGAEDGFMAIKCREHSVNLKGAPVGEDGASITQWTLEAYVTGDSPEHQEILEGLSKEQLIVLVKDQQCPEPNTLIQLGDEQLQATLKVEFDSQATNSGAKFYKLTAVIRGHRYFYSGALTLKP
jgi:hypothetical protein